MEKIIKIKRSVEDELFKRPGVTGVEIGYKIKNGKQTNDLAIRVHVKEKKDVDKDQIIPDAIEGVKTDVLERIYYPAADTTTYDPLMGGISIGKCDIVNAGTLGCIVFDNASNDPMLLSCWHVIAREGCNVGDVICQPGRSDGGQCPNNGVASLQRWRINEKVDCAVAKLDSSRGKKCEIADMLGINGTSIAQFGQEVWKRGRTSNVTRGIVESIDFSSLIDYGGTTGPIMVKDQIGIAPDLIVNLSFFEEGDSGSVLVNSNNEVVGLLHAHLNLPPFTGHAMANRIANVLTALDIHMC